MRRARLVLAAGAALVAGRALVRRVRSVDLHGCVAFITGGTRGLGLVLAREMAREGAVAICARDQDELDRARRDLEARGLRVTALACDVTDAEQVARAVAEAEQELGPIDVLINNAGSIEVGPLEAMTLGDFERALAVNFWGGVHATLAVLPSMRRRGTGRIVNITSIGGKLAVPHLLPYSASKFAFVGFSEGLRAELAGAGIVVTTVCPGLMRTGSARNADFKGRHRAEYAWFSISDALPGITLSAERAARQVIAACRRGDAEVVLSVPAKAAALFHGVFPGLASDLLGLVDRLLPSPGGIGARTAKGYESQSPLSPSPLTALGDRAAVRNNEVA